MNSVSRLVLFGNHFLLFLLLLISLWSCKKDSKSTEEVPFIKFFGTYEGANAFSIAKTNDNGFVLVGSKPSKGRTDKDFYIVNVDATGTLVWEKSLGGNGEEECSDVLVLSDGRILAAGFSTSDNFRKEGYLVTLDAGGVLLSSYQFGTPNQDYLITKLHSVDQDSILLIGQVVGAEKEDANFFVRKIKGQQLVWHREIGITYGFDDVASFGESSESYFYFYGTIHRGTEYDQRLVATTNEGAILWDYSYGEQNSTDEFASTCSLVDDNAIWLIAYEKRENDYKTILSQVTSSGTMIWSKPMAAANTVIHSVIKNSMQQMIVAGYTLGLDGTKNGYLAALSPLGELIWEREYGGSGDDEAKKVLLLEDQSIIVISTVHASTTTLIGMFRMTKEGRFW